MYNLNVPGFVICCNDMFTILDIAVIHLDFCVYKNCKCMLYQTEWGDG